MVQPRLKKTSSVDHALPVTPPRFAPWPVFEEDEIEAAVATLASGRVNYWTGYEGREFEREFAELVGCRHAIALANGTVALELALYALGVGSGDEVITTSRTFIASASAVVMRGATPVVADVDRTSQNVSARTIAEQITPRTKAIIAVHLAGWPCEMDSIMELARVHGLKVIEDCAQALGASFRGRSVGSLGDIAAFSFCQDKILTTAGEGGMLTTDDDELWERAWSFKDHGKTLEAIRPHPSSAGFRWLHESFGTNWRLSEVQSAVGRVQLRKLPSWLARRRNNARVLTETLSRVPGLRVTVPPAEVEHAYYKYYAFVEPQLLRHGWDRDRIIVEIAERGVPCFSGSCSEIYLEKAFTRNGWGPPRRLPTAWELGETSLMFLVHPTLSEDDMFAVSAAVNEVMSEAVAM